MQHVEVMKMSRLVESLYVYTSMTTEQALSADEDHVRRVF